MAEQAVPVPTNLWALVEQQAADRPGGLLAVDEAGHALTFGEFRTRAERVAAGLQALGVGQGTPVSWQLPTRLTSIVLVGALARLGAVQNPCLPIYRERELRSILGAVAPACSWSPAQWRGIDYPAMARAVLDELRASHDLDTELVVVDPDLPDGEPVDAPAASDPHAARRRPGALDLLHVGHDRRTEGRAATPTPRSVTARRGIVDRLEIDRADRYPITFPFTHIGGIGMLVIQLLTGAAAIAVEQYDPERTPPILAEHGLTIAAGGTPMALLYLQAQRAPTGHSAVPEVRARADRRAPKPPTLDAELHDELGGVGSVSVYGLTEAPFAPSARYETRRLARARPRAARSPVAELRIVDDDGASLPAGATGEICVRGPLICLGYLDPARNAEAFDADGFFRTGDLGSVDEHGNLTVSGRLKDVIIRKGENIAAKDVEDVLYEHPDVVDVAVIGLPDDERGERAARSWCCVTASTLARRSTRSSTHCRAAGLAVQKIPEQVEIVDALPRNASGKVLKYQLQETYAT